MPARNTWQNAHSNKNALGNPRAEGLKLLTRYRGNFILLPFFLGGGLLRGLLRAAALLGCVLHRAILPNVNLQSIQIAV
jgi:hypothetical protein